jgi:hypothetical protein
MIAVRLLLLAVVAAGAAGVLPAHADEAYPSRPITLIAPFPPGGIADLTGRPLASALEKVLKNPVALVNRQGAAGAVGMNSVAVAKPDGYTLLVALSSISIIPEADKLFGRQPAYTVARARGKRRVSSWRTRRSAQARSPSAPPACTGRSTWRWSCSRRRPASSCATFRTAAAVPP